MDGASFQVDAFGSSTSRTHERYCTNASGNNPGCYLLDKSEKLQDKGLKNRQTRSHAIILYDSVPTDCIKQVVSTKTDVILHQRTPTPRLPPKIVLKEAFGIGKSIADEDGFKIDLSVQGVPHKAVLEDEERTKRIRKLAHTLKKHSEGMR